MMIPNSTRPHPFQQVYVPHLYIHQSRMVLQSASDVLQMLCLFRPVVLQIVNKQSLLLRYHRHHRYDLIYHVIYHQIQISEFRHLKSPACPIQHRYTIRLEDLYSRMNIGLLQTLLRKYARIYDGNQTNQHPNAVVARVNSPFSYASITVVDVALSYVPIVHHTMTICVPVK